MFRTYSMELAGRTLTAEIGRVAEQANGAVLLRYGDTTVLVTATASEKPRDGIDFFPLSIDYEERLYSVGKIPGTVTTDLSNLVFIAVPDQIAIHGFQLVVLGKGHHFPLHAIHIRQAQFTFGKRHQFFSCHKLSSFVPVYEKAGAFAPASFLQKITLNASQHTSGHSDSLPAFPASVSVLHQPMKKKYQMK